jgi:Universal stress protein UspA and related nucleotide-binding proteins
MYNILMPVGAENADSVSAQAAAVEGLPGDPDEVCVIVMHAFTDNPSGASISQIKPARRMAENLEEDGYTVEFDERSGNPAKQILATADDHDADLVCIGGRKRSPTGKALFGSVTQSVLLDADVPVMVCHPEQ